MAFEEERGIIGRTWDFIGSAAVTTAGVFGATAAAATVFSLGYGLTSAAGLGGFLSTVAGVIVTGVAIVPVGIVGVTLGGVATGLAATAGAALGMKPNGWGITAGVGLGLAATFSMISSLTSTEPDVDSMLKNTEPYSVADSVAEINETGGALSDEFANTSEQVITVNGQFFTVDAPKAETIQHFQQ